MELFIVRHSLAAGGVPDAARPLTPEGRTRFVQQAERLRSAGVRLDAVHHSPLARAVETAALLSQGVGGKLAAAPGLTRAPDADLLSRFEHERLAAVGHFPFVGELAGWLVWGGRGAGEGLAFEPGSVAWLSGAPVPGGMTLRAFWPLPG